MLQRCALVFAVVAIFAVVMTVVDARPFPQVAAARRQVGRDLGGLAARPVPVRKSFGTARSFSSLRVAHRGAVDQTFRLVIKPDLWGARSAVRLSNVFGARP